MVIILTYHLIILTPFLNIESKNNIISSNNTQHNTNTTISNTSKQSKQTQIKTFTDKDVVILTESNFDNLLKNNKDLWFVKFYTNWCGYCKSLEPFWNQFATEMKGKRIKIAMIEGDNNKKLIARFAISGFPVVKIFIPNGNLNSPEIYEVY